MSSSAAKEITVEPTTLEDNTLSDLVSDISQLDALTQGWDEQQLRVLKARDVAVEALHKEAFARLLRHVRQVEGTQAALREAAQDTVVFTVLRHLGIVKPSLAERIDEALDSVRPMLKSHQGDVKLIDIKMPEVTIQLMGSCEGCPASELTLKMGVEKAIKEHCPEITTIHNISSANDHQANEGIVSPFAQAKKWSKVMAYDELSDGAIKVADIDERKLLLYRYSGRVKCFDNACAHLGFSLEGGELSNGVITCPYHGFEYHLESGECLTMPEVQLHVHKARVRDDWIEVQLT